MPIQPVSGEIKAQPLNDNFSYLDSKASSMIGGPKETFTSTSELNSKYPNGSGSAMLVTDSNGANGYLYTWNGNSWIKGPLYQAQGIADGTVVASKLAEQYNNKGFISSGTLSNLNENGLFLINPSNIEDVPISKVGILENKRTNDYFIQQYTPFDNADIIFTRTIRPSIGTISDWKKLNSNLSIKSISRQYLNSDFDSNGNIKDGDINELKESGTYLLTGTSINSPIGFDGSSLLTVQKNGQWIHQSLSILQNPSQKAFRFYFEGNDSWGEWELDGEKELSGLEIVNFGDSLFGNTQGSTSVSNFIANKTGAVVYNCAFGGTRMGAGQEIDRWQAFSMFRLADEIVKEATDDTKWDIQNTAISNKSWVDKPSYFDRSLERLKGIDFSTINILTIAYGTNDYTGGNAIDDAANSYNTDTFAGALRYSLEKIMTKYPNIKVLLCTPTYRLWFNSDGSVDSDSDSRDYAGTGTLTGYVDKTKDIAKEYKIPHSDNYYELGINRFNALNFFTVQDGTHHNAIGRKVLGEKIGSVLQNI